MAKICPATGKECFVDCGDDSNYCYVNRVAPVIAKRINGKLETEAFQYSQLQNLDGEGKQKLVSVLARRAKELL